ncbi:nitroreductase family protein [Candidatus Omnitrophota bacterium]
METFETIARRASIREYAPEPIEPQLLERLVDAGRRAPSARAVEPWEFVVIQDKGTLNELSRLSPNGSFVKGAQACLAIFCKDTKYYLEDGCAATENILLAAADLGLGACWIAGDKKDYCAQVGALLNAPTGLRLISLISLGWPKQQAGQTKNRQLAELIHWEKF